MKRLIKITIIGLALATAGCSDEARQSGGEVDAVYWHEGQRYTASVIDEGGLVTHKNIPPWRHAGRNTILLYTDVEPDAKSWYECDWMWNDFTGASGGMCEIHIHNLDELGTKDWNHGKFGSGRTERID